MNDHVVIGIDGGGSKTRVVAISGEPDAPPDIIAFADSGPCNIAVMTVQEALGNVCEAIGRLEIDPDRVLAICAGVAGFSFESRRRDFLAALASLYGGAMASVIPDFVAAHLGANAGAAGITAIAGTGSVAYGRSRTGVEHRAGGYGYLIDDAGSGYGIGRRAVAAVLMAGDGSGSPTILTELLGEALGSVERTYLVPAVYGGKIDRVQTASLARIVAAAAADGDSVSLEIFTASAQAQAAAVIAVARKLFAAGDTFPIALYGGVWNAGPFMVEPFERAVSAAFPGSAVHTARLSAEIGAALHARWELQT